MQKRVVKNNKKIRGISPVIATILLILIVLIIIGLLWFAINPFLSEKTSGFATCDKVDIVVDATSGVSCYDSDKKIVAVEVKKGSNNINITKLQFIFSYAGSDEVNIQEAVFDLNTQKVFYFNMTNVNGGEKPTRVGVVAIIKVNEAEKICDVAAVEISIKECSLSNSLISNTKIAYDGWGCVDDSDCDSTKNLLCYIASGRSTGACCLNRTCSGAGASGIPAGSSGGGGGGSSSGSPSPTCTPDCASWEDCVNSICVDNSLIFHAKLDADTSFNDSSSFARVGTCDSCPTLSSAGRIGEAYYFNRNPIIFNKTNFPASNSDITFSVWVKANYNDCQENERFPFSIYNEDNIFGFNLRTFSDPDNSNYVRYMLNSGQVGISITNICDGNWHLLTGVYDKTNTKAIFYVDGNNVGESLGVVLPDNVPGSYFFIGGKSDFGKEMFGVSPPVNDIFTWVGAIDDVKVWNRVLTPTEILNEYSSVPCAPDCVGKTCGADGCGGNCTPGCRIGETCNNDGSCV